MLRIGGMEFWDDLVGLLEMIFEVISIGIVDIYDLIRGESCLNDSEFLEDEI